MSTFKKVSAFTILFLSMSASISSSAYQRAELDDADLPQLGQIVENEESYVQVAGPYEAAQARCDGGSTSSCDDAYSMSNPYAGMTSGEINRPHDRKIYTDSSRRQTVMGRFVCTNSDCSKGYWAPRD